MRHALAQAFPALARRIPRLQLSDLPTPLETIEAKPGAGPAVGLLVKRDDLTGVRYGGNKLRKLEFLLAQARARGASRIATFGTVASNHALATTICASATGFDCLCFLSHQAPTPKVPIALNLHCRYGTEIVRYGGSRQERLATLRGHLRGRRSWVIPMGGSSWRGVLGFVDAGLELGRQLRSSGREPPERIYVASGTMGTAAGLGLGLVLAGLRSEVHAVRVTHESIANPAAMRRLVDKTAAMMRRFDRAVPADLARKTRIVFRDGFFAGGYARSDDATDAAVAFGREQLGLALETTYTGKALAALLCDARRCEPRNWLFWNTCSSRPLPDVPGQPLEPDRLPAEFLRYFD